MKLLGRVVLFSCLFGFFFQIAAVAQEPGDVIPGRYIVLFRSDVPSPAAAAQELGRAHGFQVRHIYQFALRGMAIELPADARAQSRILGALQRDGRVRAIGQDRVIAAFADTAPKGVRRINANPSPNTGAGIRVAIVDTGLAFSHPDLAANINTSLSRTCIGANPNCSAGGGDDNGHGTFVGGIVAAAANNAQLIGVAPQTELIAIKVLNSSGSGSFSDINAGLDYLTSLASSSSTFVHVANMSLGARCSVCTDNSTDPTIASFHTAVRSLVNSGTTVVVAAGNDGVDASTTVPASFDEVVTVSALADFDGLPGGQGGSVVIIGMGRVADDSFAKFSNSGADIDVIAPGVNETSLSLSGGTSTGSGTSFSSPHAAGVAAIYIKHHLAQSGTLPSPETVRRALIETGECANGAGTILHGATGCSQKWSGDPDSFAEPLVRADKVVTFSAGPVADVAVTSVSVPGTVQTGSAVQVEVGVANLGTQAESFTVMLSSDVEGAIGSQEVSALSAGASTTLSFSWTPSQAGAQTLTATASTVPGETNTANNSKTASVTVEDPSEPPPPSADPTISSISPNSMGRNTTIHGVVITGTNFVSGATVTFEGSGPLPSASNVSVTSDTSISLSITSKSGGGPSARTYDVVVRNPDGKTARLVGGFTVTP